MPTTYTSLIGLALPTTGELTGTWGTVVNDYITRYLDAAIAGTQTLSTDADVTLTVTNGSNLGATSAQYAILNCTGARTVQRTITVPAASKTYLVINGTTGGQSIKVVGAGPTTGVTLVNGERALIAWDGSDFVKAGSNFVAAGANTQVQYNSSGALAGSANLTFNGTTLTANSAAVSTGNLAFTGTAQRITGDFSNATQSNRLAFQTSTTNGSTIVNAITNGAGVTSAFQANAGADISNPVSFTRILVNATESRVEAGITNVSGTYLPMTFYTGGSERVRVDTSGNVGIGTASPVGKLSVNLADASGSTSAWDSTYATFGAAGSTTGKAVGIGFNATSNYGEIRSVQPGVTWTDLYIRGNNLNFYYSLAGASTLGMVLNTSGNVGIGTASPGTKLDVQGNVSGGGVNGRALNNDAGASSSAGFTVSTGGGVSAAFFAFGTSAAYVGVSSNHPLAFQTNNTERMRIDSSGNVGIGTASPGAKIEVVGSQANWRRFSTDTAPFYFPVIKARGVAGAPTTVVLGDAISAWQAYGYTGSNELQAAGITARVDVSGTVSSTSMPGAIDFATTANGASSSTTRMTIDSSGNVGIGTASPGKKLQVADTTNQLSLTTGTNELIARASSTEVALYTFQALPMVFYTNNTERLRIDSSGNVGIGVVPTANTVSRLFVAGDNTLTGASRGFLFNMYYSTANLRWEYAGTGTGAGWIDSGSGNYTFQTTGSTSGVAGGAASPSERMRIDASGNVGIGTASPGSIAKLTVANTGTTDNNRLGVSASNYLSLPSFTASFIGQGDISATGTQCGLSNASLGYVLFQNTSAGLIYTNGGTPLVFGTSGTERMRIDSSGNVGIGTASPGAKLDVVSSGGANIVQSRSTSGYASFLANASTGNQAYHFFQVNSVETARITSDSGNVLTFSTGAALERMRIDSSGNVGIGTASPSERLVVGGGGNMLLAGASTGDQSIRVGSGRSGNGNSYIDLQGDTTYNNGLRLIRVNSGANAASNIEHRGTGALQLITQEAGPIVFYTTATERMRFLAGGGITSEDRADAVGYKGTPLNEQSANYTLVIGDMGKSIVHPASDNNPRTFTIPANGTVAYPVGTTITFINMINTVTIAITTDTMYLAGSGSTGSRTLAAYGMATAVKMTSTTWIISGNGLT